MRFNCKYTFRERRSDRVRDTVDIVSPRTSLAVSAFVRLAVSPVSVQVTSSSAPTLVLDSEDDHFPLSSHLVAFVDGVSTSLVVSSDSRVRAVDLGNSPASSVFPASKMGVG